VCQQKLSCFEAEATWKNKLPNLAEESIDYLRFDQVIRQIKTNSSQDIESYFSDESITSEVQKEPKHRHLFIFVSIVVLFASTCWIFIANSPHVTSTELPFTLYDAENNPLGQFASLSEAVNKSRNGSRIEICDGHHFVDTPINLSFTASRAFSLKFMAAENHEPILIFEPNGRDEGEAMISTNVLLELDGLELRLLPEAHRPTYSLVEVLNEGALVANDCSFLVEDEGHCLSGQSKWNLKNCRFESQQSNAINIEAIHVTQTRFQDCSIVADVGMQIMAESLLDIELFECHFQCRDSFFVQPNSAVDKSLIRVTTESSVFQDQENNQDVEEEFAQTGSVFHGKKRDPIGGMRGPSK
ncbi:MAG: hypothetical protein AAGA30_18505, partial [Planctomycetota bacterium]